MIDKYIKGFLEVAYLRLKIRVVCVGIGVGFIFVHQKSLNECLKPVFVSPFEFVS